ncbi:uncharacterized protein BcabD6B2_31820 [Babesia caballi]|uniref:Uncharacterized protein n=1 Tax=Babesia caballi TaxID=5871 RepID=A0AAV4LVU1_BABCB|nr:hypothetical protein, conserved [Babesia caballi]
MCYRCPELSQGPCPRFTYHNLTAFADRPLDLRDLETPHDRVSVFTQGLQYLAGSFTALYPLRFFHPTTDGQFYPGSRGKTEDHPDIHESYLNAISSSSHTVTDADSDIKDVKKIFCRGKPVHDSVVHGSGESTPLDVNSYLSASSPLPVSSEVGAVSPFDLEPPAYGVDASSDPELHSLSTLRKSPILHRAADFQRPNRPAGGSSLGRNSKVMKKAFVLPGSPGPTQGDEALQCYRSVKASNPDAGLRRTPDSSFSLPEAEPSADLLNFARRFRAKYGATASVDTVTSGTAGRMEQSLFAKPAFNGADGFPSTPSYTPATNRQPANESAPRGRADTNRSSLGFVAASEHFPGADDHFSYQLTHGTPTWSTRTSVEPPIGSTASQARHNISSVRQLGHTRSSDILLRDYRAGNVHEKPSERVTAAAAAHANERLLGDSRGSSVKSSHTAYGIEADVTAASAVGDIRQDAPVFEAVCRTPTKDVPHPATARRTYDPLQSARHTEESSLTHPSGTYHAPAHTYGGSNDRSAVETPAAPNPSPYEPSPARQPPSLAEVNKQIDAFFRERMPSQASEQRGAAPGTGYGVELPARQYESATRPMFQNADSYHSPVVELSSSTARADPVPVPGSRNLEPAGAQRTAAKPSGQAVAYSKTTVGSPPAMTSDSGATYSAGSVEYSSASDRSAARGLLQERPRATTAPWTFDFPPQAAASQLMPPQVMLAEALGASPGEDAYPAAEIDALKSGDVNLYDSTCLPIPDPAYVERAPERKVAGPPHARQADSFPVALQKSGTELERSPADHNFDDNMPTRTNQLDSPNLRGTTPPSGDMVFGEELAFYVPGGVSAGGVMKDLSDGIFFEDGALPQKAKGLADPGISAAGFNFSDANLSTTFERLDSSAGGLFAPSAEKAATIGGPRRGSYADSLEALFDKCEYVAYSQDTVGQFDNHASKAANDETFDNLPRSQLSQSGRQTARHCQQECHRSGRSSRAQRGVPGHNGLLGDSNRCVARDETESSGYPRGCGPLLGHMGVRYAAAKADPSDFEEDRVFDGCSLVSSNYVHIPCDRHTSADGDCECYETFSSSEGDTSAADSGAPAHDQSAQCTVKDVLSRHLGGSGSIENLTSLLKQLGSMIEEKDCAGEPNGAASTFAQDSGDLGPCTTRAQQATDSRRSTLRSVETNSTPCTSASPRVEKAVNTDAQTHGFDVRSASAAPGRRSVSISVGTETVQEPSARSFLGNGRVVLDAATNTPSRPSWHSWRVGQHSGDAESLDTAVPRTKEAMVSRMVEPFVGAGTTGRADGVRRVSSMRDTAAHMSSDCSSDSDKAARGNIVRSASLPEGVTLDELLDMYGEFRKLLLLMHVKDPKSLVRAVTARLNKP